MAKRPFVALPCYQVFINALPSVDAYRKWFFANYSKPDAHAEFKARAAVAFAKLRVELSEADIRDGLRRWHAEYGDECPPYDVAAFVRFLQPSLSGSGRIALAAARAVLHG